MKKIYLQPQTQVVNVKTERLMNIGSPTQNVSVTETEYYEDMGEVASRRGPRVWNDWDDEDDF